MSQYTCDALIIHKKTIDKVKSNTLDEQSIVTLSHFFKVISDPTRIRILFALKNHELCVCDISILLEMTQSAISHQLKVLREANLVAYNKVGKSVFYRLSDEHVHTIFNQSLEHIKEDKDEKSI